MFSIEAVTTLEKLASLETLWGELCKRASAEVPYQSLAWYIFWWQRFGAGNDMLVLVLRQEGTARAILPLMRSRIRLKGLPVTVIQFMANYYSIRAGIITDTDRADVVSTAINWIKSSSYAFDMLWLDLVEKDGRTDNHVKAFVRDERYHFLVLEGSVSPYIKVKVTWEAYLNSFSKKLRSKIRHIRKLLDEEGSWEIVNYTDSTIDLGVQEMLMISRNTWKFKQGTAIANNPDKVAFFAEFARWAAARGWMHLRVLKLHGEPIAFSYTIVYADNMYIDKIGFDERYQHFSPGQFLLLETIRDAFSRHCTECDLLGENEPYKARLTSTTRPHVKYWIFANTVYGIFLYMLATGTRAIKKIFTRIRQSIGEAKGQYE